MRRYKCNPHWITVKFKGNACVRCKRPIHRGERAFYQPEGRFLYCGDPNRGKRASRESSACAFDEKNNTSM